MDTRKARTQLWNIADSLRGKMNADEFRDYCLGFIFISTSLSGSIFMPMEC
ncbi:type I restriction-modification system subunit M N-terminal domain-containing protein [Kamptonema formosum]|uniref:type I restriction-modification system subunit M N-terminal domain-containing protein n=1 Tax=Kamptonema formosum TaxID=331992 RepID=UPI003898D7C4